MNYEIKVELRLTPVTRIYLAGGEYNQTGAYEYNQTTNSWTRIPPGR